KPLRHDVADNLRSGFMLRVIEGLLSSECGLDSFIVPTFGKVGRILEMRLGQRNGQPVDMLCISPPLLTRSGKRLLLALGHIWKLPLYRLCSGLIPDGCRLLGLGTVGQSALCCPQSTVRSILGE